MSLIDDFNRANSSDLGPNWTPLSPANAEILDGKLRATGIDSFKDTVIHGDSSGDFRNGRVTVEFTPSMVSSAAQVYCRYDPATKQGYILYCTNFNFVLATANDGTLSTLAEVNHGMVAGQSYVLDFLAMGDKLQGTLSHLLSGPIATLEAVDTTYTASGSVAVSVYEGTVDYDNFVSTGESASNITILEAFHDGTALLVNETSVTAHVIDFVTGVNVASVTGLTTNGSGFLSDIVDDYIIPEKRYRVIVAFSGGEVAFVKDTLNSTGVIYANASDFQTSYYTATSYDGLGVEGQDVVAAGTHGASFIHPSITLPADNNAQFRGLITSAPAVTDGAGTITAFEAYEDGSFNLLVDDNCTVEWTWSLYKDNAIDTAGLTSTVNFIPPLVAVSINTSIESETSQAINAIVPVSATASTVVESETAQTVQAVVPVLATINTTSETETSHTINATDGNDSMPTDLANYTIQLTDWSPGEDGKIRGLDKDGLLGGGGVPDAPSAFSVSYLSDTSLSLSWSDNSDDETGFELDRSPNGSTGWSQIATPAANATSATDTSLTVDTTYYYRLRAVNGSGESTYATANGTTTYVSGPSSAPDLMSDGFESGDMSSPTLNTINFNWEGNNATSIVTMHPNCGGLADGTPTAIYNNGAICNGPQTPAGPGDWAAKEGDNSLRFRYAAGTDMAEQRFNFDPQPDLWIRYWIRVPVNFYQGSLNSKFLSLWGGTYDSYGTITWNTRPSGGGSATIGVADGGILGGENLQTPFIDVNTDLGRWMQLVFHVKTASADGANDGELHLYRRWEDESNFTLLHEDTSLIRQWEPGTLGYRQGYFMGWANDPYDVDTEWLVDTVEFSSESLL